MNQPSLFDGAAARDAALTRVHAAAHPGWIDAARTVLLTLADHGKPFTTDSVWEILEMRGVPQTAEPRALGAVVMRLARQKKIVKTGEYRNSSRAINHGRPIPVWKGA